ncbi:MAG: hypothetical protein IJ583_01320 [Firmicutes bacterium]|nr:hypothetical protein [Bacillota bacterium]
MDKIEQAKLYYSYMLSDGCVTNNEKEIFDKICKEIHIGKNQKKSIIEECSKIRKTMSCIDLLKKNAKRPFYFWVHSNTDKAKILWNLICLGYADSNYSKDKKEVVDYIRKYWKISENIYSEMIDIIETCSALEKYKGWCEGLNNSVYKSEKIKQIDKDIKYVQETIVTIIQETNY